MHPSAQHLQYVQPLFYAILFSVMHGNLIVTTGLQDGNQLITKKLLQQVASSKVIFLSEGKQIRFPKIFNYFISSKEVYSLLSHTSALSLHWRG